MILTLPPPLPGLQNNKDSQYSEDTKLKSKESSDLYYTFHKQLGIGYQCIQTNQQSVHKAICTIFFEGERKEFMMLLKTRILRLNP